MISERMECLPRMGAHRDGESGLKAVPDGLFFQCFQGKTERALYLQCTCLIAFLLGFEELRGAQGAVTGWRIGKRILPGLHQCEIYRDFIMNSETLCRLLQVCRAQREGAGAAPDAQQVCFAAAQCHASQAVS